MPDKTDEKQRKFQKGKSGNPYGRPKGMRNKVTILAEALLQTEVEAICRKAIEEAKNGNIQAIKLILDRILLRCRQKVGQKIVGNKQFSVLGLPLLFPYRPYSAAYMRCILS